MKVTLNKEAKSLILENVTFITSNPDEQKFSNTTGMKRTIVEISPDEVDNLNKAVEELNKLQDTKINVRVYTTKEPDPETGEITNFIYLKLSSNLKFYNASSKTYSEIKLTTDQPNYQVSGTLAISFLKSKSGNDFYRATHLMAKQEDVVNLAVNPFGLNNDDWKPASEVLSGVETLKIEG